MCNITRGKQIDKLTASKIKKRQDARRFLEQLDELEKTLKSQGIFLDCKEERKAQ